MEETAVSFGKVPSWSVRNKKGQAINTHWVVRFKKNNTGVKHAECFLHLLKFFASHEFEKTLGNLSDKTKKTTINAEPKPHFRSRCKIQDEHFTDSEEETERKPPAKSEFESEDDASKNLLDDDSSKENEGRRDSMSQFEEQDDSFANEPETQVAMSQPLIIPCHYFNEEA